jgi:hypothetical protein
MKKNIILFLMTLLFVFAFGVACTPKNQGQQGTANVVTEIKINRTELVLPIYGEYELKVTKNNILQEATWSSNNDCVSVSENGKIVAHEAGSALITAIFEGQEFVCEVTVVMTDTIPLLDVNTGDELVLEIGDEFVLVPSLKWEGASIDVEQVEYQSTLRVETNEDLSATIYAEAAGQYDVTVIVKWHGLNLYKQIKVLVK